MMNKTNKGDSKRVKVDKPLAERKRRARINDALLQLKNMVLQSVEKQGSFMSKLEKADILEMTIEYINQIKRSNKTHEQQVSDPSYTNGFSECNTYILDYLDKDTSSDVMDNGLRVRLVQHMANVSSSSEFEACGSGLQIVGFITPHVQPVDGVHNISITTAPGAECGATNMQGAEDQSTGSLSSLNNASSSRASGSQAAKSIESATSLRTGCNQGTSDRNAHIDRESSLMPVELNIRPKVNANVIEPMCSSANNNYENITAQTVSSKPRKVLGDISNVAGNVLIKKQSQCGSSKRVPKPFKKRITEEMLQRCAASFKGQTNSDNKEMYNVSVSIEKTPEAAVCNTSEISKYAFIDIGEVSRSVKNARGETREMQRDTLVTVGEIQRPDEVSLLNFAELNNCFMDNTGDSSNSFDGRFDNESLNEMAHGQNVNNNINMTEQLTALNTRSDTELVHAQLQCQPNNMYQFYPQETFASNVWRPW